MSWKIYMEEWYLVHLDFFPWRYYLERTKSSNILILTRQIFPHLYSHENWFYDGYINKTVKKGILMMMILGSNQKSSYKEEWDTHLVMIRYRKFGIDIGKYQEPILEEKENKLDIFIFLGQNYVRLKVIWRWVNFYKMLLLILPLGSENTSKNWNCTDSALLEECRI